MRASVASSVHEVAQHLGVPARLPDQPDADREDGEDAEPADGEAPGLRGDLDGQGGRAARREEHAEVAALHVRRGGQHEQDEDGEGGGRGASRAGDAGDEDDEGGRQLRHAAVLDRTAAAGQHVGDVRGPGGRGGEEQELPAGGCGQAGQAADREQRRRRGLPADDEPAGATGAPVELFRRTDPPVLVLRGHLRRLLLTATCVRHRQAARPAVGRPEDGVRSRRGCARPRSAAARAPGRGRRTSGRAGRCTDGRASRCGPPHPPS